MNSGKYSFIIEQGSTIGFPITLMEGKIPMNLENYSAKMEIKETPDSTGSIAILSSSLNADGTGLNMRDALGGTINLYISSCSSSQFNFNEAYYDLDIMSGGECPIVSRVIEGKIKLSKQITTL